VEEVALEVEEQVVKDHPHPHPLEFFPKWWLDTLLYSFPRSFMIYQKII
jgi:hypothetical protein